MRLLAVSGVVFLSIAAWFFLKKKPAIEPLGDYPPINLQLSPDSN